MAGCFGMINAALPKRQTRGVSHGENGMPKRQPRKPPKIDFRVPPSMIGRPTISADLGLFCAILEQ